MLFTSKISLQPKLEVITTRTAPTKIFAKMFHALTFGITSDKEKQQTFTAISMLQELNVVLRQQSINNIVRLAKDGNDFYYDAHSRDNDLGEAMKEFNMNTDHFEATLFNDLYLVLEHEDRQLRYLIEIEVKRVHKEDEMPININISGVIKNLSAQDGESEQALQQRVSTLFSKKSAYEQYVKGFRTHFDGFSNNLEQAFRKLIRCEEVNHQHKVQVLRPRQLGKTCVSDKRCAPSVYHGYPGWDGAALYTFFWLSMMNDVGAEVMDLDVISDSSEVLLSVGEEAMDVAESTVFDSSIDQQDLAVVNDTDGFDVGSTDDDSSSWLSFGGDSGGDSGSCSGSSCSSCGGGCGS
ncbi:MAG: hypothetical protein ACI8WB_000345 [Phenylobacterium sp.]|jgi:hypothetical protein